MQGLSRAWLLLACCAPWTLGQDTDARTYPKLEYFAGYSAIETNDHAFHFANLGRVGDLDYDEKGRAFEIAAIRNVSRYFSLVGDFSAHFSSNEFPIPVTPPCSQAPCPITMQNASIDPRLFDFLAGPELKWRNHTRVTPFVNSLFGLAYSTATFNTSGPAGSLSRTDSEAGFAMTFSGGVEVRIIRRASFRGCVTYGQNFVGSNSLPRQRADTVGWSAGVLFH